MELNELIENVRNCLTYGDINKEILKYLCDNKAAIENYDDSYKMKFWKLYTDLGEPVVDKYYENQIEGYVCTKNFCSYILAFFKYNRRDKLTPLFIDDFINLIETIYPEGINENFKLYYYQAIDYSLQKFDKNNPSLIQIKEVKKYLFENLIKSCIKIGMFLTALSLFRNYSGRYGIQWRTILVNLYQDGNKLIEYSKISDFDLRYTLLGIKTELNFSKSREFEFLKTIKKSTITFKSDINKISNELIKEIRDYDDRFLDLKFGERQRYYLSILCREYTEFLNPESNKAYVAWLKYNEKIIDDELDKREGNYRKIIASHLGDGEVEYYAKEFLKNGNHDNYNVDILYKKIEKNKLILTDLAACQKRIQLACSSYHDDSSDLIFNGDLTFLVSCQIKNVERYLKEIIAQNLVGETIYSMYGKDYKKTVNSKAYMVKNGDTAESLSSKVFSIELATAANIVYINRAICKSKDVKVNDVESYFNYKNGNNAKSFTKWKDSYRNGYFHIHHVASMQEAEKVHQETAFCLVECIHLLTELKH